MAQFRVDGVIKQYFEPILCHNYIDITTGKGSSMVSSTILSTNVTGYANNPSLRHGIIQEISLARTVNIWYNDLDLETDNLEELASIESKRATHQVWNVFEIRQFMSKNPGRHSLNPFELLARYNENRCQDPRDKLYGIQSLFHPRYRVEVRYDRSATEVIQDLANTYKTRGLLAGNKSVDSLVILGHSMNLHTDDFLHHVTRLYAFGEKDQEDVNNENRTHLWRIYGHQLSCIFNNICILKERICSTHKRTLASTLFAKGLNNCDDPEHGTTSNNGCTKLAVTLSGSLWTRQTLCK